MHSHVQSHELVHLSGVRCHVLASSVRGLLLCTLLNRKQNSNSIYFKPRMPRSKLKNSSEVVGPAIGQMFLRHGTYVQSGTRRLPFRMKSSVTVSPLTRKEDLLPRRHWVVSQEGPCEPGSVPSASRVSDIPACPPFPVTADPSALLSLIILSLVVSNSCPPDASTLYASCCTTILFKGQYCKIKGFFLIFCVCCVLFM